MAEQKCRICDGTIPDDIVGERGPSYVLKHFMAKESGADSEATNPSSNASGGQGPAPRPPPAGKRIRDFGDDHPCWRAAPVRAQENISVTFREFSISIQ